MNARSICLVSAISCALILGRPALAKDLRIGVVNMERAVRETEEGRAAEGKLMDMKKKLENELQRKLKEFQDDQEKLRKAMSILKDDEKRKRAAESQKRYEDLQKRYLDAERELMDQKTKVMLKITDRLNKVIQSIAEKEKYDYVFNNAAVLWAPRHVDMTNEVIRALNKK